MNDNLLESNREAITLYANNVMLFKTIILRNGQAVFNEMYRLCPDEAQKLVGVYGKDCFYDDSFIDSFLDEMSRLLTEKGKSFVSIIQNKQMENEKTIYVSDHPCQSDDPGSPGQC